MLIREICLLFLLVVSLVFFGCTSDVRHLGTDDRSELVKDKVWRLYSDDVIDTAGGQKSYFTRTLADSCVTLLYFHDKDSLTQVDSCLNGSISVTGGKWHFYSDNGSLTGFLAAVKTLPGDEENKFMYSFTGDTMQLEIRPSILVDTLHAIYRERVKTFIGH